MDKPMTQDELADWLTQPLQMRRGDREMYVRVRFFRRKEDGTTDMSGNAGTWEVTSDGATVTSNEATGTFTYPVKKLGDDIVVDCSALLNGTEYLVVLSK